MGKNRRGRRGKKSAKPTGPPTICGHNGEHNHSDDDHDETDIARYVFTDEGFYTTNDPKIIAQNNRDMGDPAPPLYIKCKGKKWRDLHEELRFKTAFEFSVKCVDDDTLLELQLANMYDYKAVRPKIAKYIVPAPGKAGEKNKNVKEKTEKDVQEKTEEKPEEEKTAVKKKRSTPPVKALLRGLPWLCDEEGVRDGLLYEGFGDVAVKLHNRTNKKQPPLFILVIETGEDARRRKDAAKVYELTKLLGFQVTVEPLPQEYEPKPQCYKCQQEGHVAKYCRNRAVCVKCADFHDSRLCPLKKEHPPKCVRCHGPHVASWRGCPAFSGFSLASLDDSSVSDLSSDEDDEIVEHVLCSKKTVQDKNGTEQAQEEETTVELNLFCDVKKKRRRRKLRKPPFAQPAQEAASEQPNSVGVAQEETAKQVDCSEQPKDEETAEAAANCDSTGAAKKRKRRRKKKEGEQATATSPPSAAPEEPAGGAGGGNGECKHEQVAVMKKEVKELEGQLVAAVSRLVNERLSATVLETVQAVLKGTK